MIRTKMWPNLCRDCAVTELVDSAPRRIEIAPDLLGHTDLQTTRKHPTRTSRIDHDLAGQAGVTDVYVWGLLPLTCVRTTAPDPPMIIRSHRVISVAERFTHSQPRAGGSRRPARC
jgi:hypothetical protein